MAEKPAPKCFVMMPFAGEFEDIYFFGIVPTLTEMGLIAQRADQIVGTGLILKDIIRAINNADIVIVDVSKANPNVFYELGISHALAKQVILMSQSIDDVPFDIRSYRVLIYDPTLKGIKRFQHELRKAIKSSLESRNPNSPVFDAIPEVDKVPRSDLTVREKEITELKSLLALREAEIKAIQQATPQSSQITGLANELKDQLKAIADQVLSTLKEEVIKTSSENERLKHEIELLQSAQQELRRLKGMTLVNPHWKGRNMTIDSELCFLLMPFRESWSDDVWELLKGVISKCGLRCERADEKDGRVIMDDIWDGVSRARVIIADLTAKNPNVTYEVGLADVLGKDVILLSQTPHDVPFDFLGLRLITYENSIGGVRKLSEELEKRLYKVIKHNQPTISGIQP